MLGFLAFLGLVVFAHAPLLGAGLFAWDYAELFGGRSLASRWSSLVSVPVFGLPATGASALAWRLEVLLLLLGIAAAARSVLVRLLEPWIGPHPARAAALVAAILLPLHPSAPVVTAELAGLGEVFALLLALLSTALFLRGRQTEDDAFTAASLALLVLASAASSVALLFSVGLASLEYACVRRHRKRSLRLRTAATTALVFGAGAWLPVALRLAGASDSPSGALPLGERLRASVFGLAQELGHVAMAAGGLGARGTLLAGLFLLLAIHPAFRAARHAPRLWGWILLAFGVTLGAALLWASTYTGARANARGLLAIVVWSAGLALALSVRARPWRGYLVAVLALAWAALAHIGARPWLTGSNALARLHAEIAALDPPRDARVLVLDPPVIVGLPPLTRDLGWLFHRALDEDADESAFDPRRVRGLSGPAFVALAATDAFRAWRRERVVVLASGRTLGRAPPDWCALELPPERAPSRELEPWRSSLTYVPADSIDPLGLEQVRLVADLATPTLDLERLAWRTRAGELGSVVGLVRERAGRRVAEFDLSRSLAWRLAGSVRSLEVEQGSRSTIERGELSVRAPELAGTRAPEVRGADWSFARPSVSEPAESGARCVLVLLALGELELLELVLEPDPLDPAYGLLAHGAQRFVARAAGAPVAWALEYRIGEHVLCRTRGSVP